MDMQNYTISEDFQSGPTPQFEIKLNRGYAAIVDEEDYEELSKYKWTVFKHRNTCYAKRGQQIDGKYRCIQMHRQIMSATDPKDIIDHKDQNGLNNTRSNLRRATHSQNKSNTKPYKGRKKYLGVWFFKPLNKWHAQVRKNGKNHHCGYFLTEDEAALAYNRKALELHGEFASLNKIEGGAL